MGRKKKNKEPRVKTYQIVALVGLRWDRGARLQLWWASDRQRQIGGRHGPQETDKGLTRTKGDI